MAKKFSPRKVSSGKLKTSPEAPKDYDSMPALFSLEKVQPGAYCFSKLDKVHKVSFAESLFKRKNMTWKEIKNLSRHGLGTEKIPGSAIKGVKPPGFLCDEDLDYLVFRYKGKNPMIGIREGRVFYILWFDHSFTLYDHGS